MVSMKKYTEDTKKRIYEKALNLIKLYGIKGWNMDMLCEEVNMSKDTLYRIVKSKEKLLTDMVSGLLAEHEKSVNLIIESETDFYVVLEKLSKQIAQFLLELESVQFKSLLKEYPKIEEMVLDYANQFDNKIDAYLRYGIEKKIIQQEVDTMLVAKSIKYISLALLNDSSCHNAYKDINTYIQYIFEGIKVNGD